MPEFIPLFDDEEEELPVPIFDSQPQTVSLDPPELQTEASPTFVELTPTQLGRDVTHQRSVKAMEVIAEAVGIPAIFRTVVTGFDQIAPGTPLADAWTKLTGKRPRRANIGDVAIAGITLLGGAGLRGAGLLLRGAAGTAARNVARVGDDAIKALGKATGRAPKAAEFSDVTLAGMEETRGALQVATEALAANGRINDPAINSEVQRIFQRIADAVELGIVPQEELPRIFAEYGIKSADEAAELWAHAIREAGSAGGRFLGTLSAAQKKLGTVFGKLIKPETARKLDIEIVEPNLFERLRTQYLQPLIQIWRGSITSQLATANRNWEVSVLGRMPLRAFEDVASNAARRVANASGARLAITPATENLTAIWRNLPSKGKDLYEEVVNTFADPVMKRHLSSVYYGMATGPIDDKSASFIAKHMRKVINGLQIANRTQEFWVRRMAFDARFTQRLQALGVGQRDLRVLMENWDTLRAFQGTAGRDGERVKVFLDSIKKAFNEAAEQALDVTFALTPKNNPVLKFYRQIPELALAHPFPRFLVNSLKFMGDHSPFGLARFATSGQRTKLVNAMGHAAAAEEAAQAVGKMVTGAFMHGAGIAIRHSDMAGDRWYQIREPFGGRIIDARPFNPLAAYLLLGEVIRQQADPDASHVQLSIGDFAEALAGIRRLTGSGLFIFDAIAKDSPEAFRDSLENFAREFIGGFTVPFRVIRDVIAAPISVDERVYRESREGNIFSSAVGNLPFLSAIEGTAAVPPPAARATREEPPGVEPDVLGVLPTSLVRQFTGISARAQTPIEQEISRLDINPNPRTGDPTLDRLINERITTKLENRLGALINSTSYQDASDFDKKERLKKTLSKLRSQTKKRVLADERPRIIQELTESLRGMSLQRAREELQKRRNAGAINAAIERAVLRNLRQSGVR